MTSLWNSLWPWMAVAGAGALHGLNPATGWMFAAALGVRSHDRMQALRALIPIAVGHAGAIGLVAAALVLGLRMDRVALQFMAAGLFVIVAGFHLLGRMPAAARKTAGHAGLALWSFMMATMHGAGLMLLPSLFAICSGNASTGEITASDSLLPALGAIGLHTIVMVVVSGLAAAGICRGADAFARLHSGIKRKPGAASSLANRGGVDT
ncbi:hypothetical protein RY831_24580 [Noviherbaspirillum sp. CPCC 100848]|uniref:Uncharacterized protein n=1 Tax=Noviherbaspirillum album TaxID=3080276 RepID=A0ABU6JF99_9BURK|nr:hypothetical protein [Noviherbaspirillum sp. CPCC 100848]MEC4722344.1 hypothetical protein [Noviherbaspirillum sp. CPCC 100848]